MASPATTEDADWKGLLEQSRALSCDEDHYPYFAQHVSLIKTHLPCLPALRLAYPLVSFREALAVEVRQRIQKEAYEEWRESLIDFLTTVEDEKKKQSRRIAAKILCNLVTSNTTTSHHLTSALLQLESRDAVNNRNWVDLLLSFRNDRLGLAPVVACLYNCMRQIPSLRTEMEQSTTLLVPTLLRHLIGSSNSINQERDAASDWIVLIITQLSIAAVYGMIAQSVTVPEQVVLLLIFRTALEEGELSGLEENDRMFLVELFLSLEKSKKTAENDSQDESVCHLILEILCEDLLLLSSNKDLWGPDVLLALLRRITCIVDSWHASTALTRNRTLSADTQRWLINSVRCLGLLCSNSRVHQDLLRTTTMTDNKRTGLHILLSTTSLAPACFTVREWAIVAIRYALEDCPANQIAVEQLQAGDAVQSADLQDMGVRVQVQQGKVSVVPIEGTDDQGKDKESA